jgi:predicted AlkP superfamily phosphohydrolase/phosphomutase
MIDGGTWDVLDKHHMPFLHSVENRSVLYSEIPMTIPAVPSILTGIDAEEHGYTSFVHDGKFLNTSCLKAQYIWETMNVRHAVVNIPGTYPVLVTDETKFMVSGFDSPVRKEKPKTYFPASLDLSNYVCDVLQATKINPNNYQVAVDKWEWLDRCIEVQGKRVSCVLNWLFVYNKVDLLIVSFAEFDRIMHFCYGNADIEKNFCFALDLELARLYRNCAPKNLLIFSDHGFCSKDDTVRGEYFLSHVPPLGPNMEGVHDSYGMIAWQGDDLPTGGELCTDINIPIDQKMVFPMIRRCFGY